ncbi:sulfotransferase family protein [Thermopirellula anaerolimosa]
MHILRTARWIPFFLTLYRSSREFVFISGPPRSGTTLLKTLLVSHSQLGGTDYESTGLFELRTFDAYRISEIDSETLRRMLADSRSILHFYESLTDTVLRQQNKQVFVDKIWPHYWRFCYTTSKFPNAKWIWLCRDPRDCYCSARKHPHIPQAHSGAAVYYAYWRKCIELCEKMLPHGAALLIRYEDLVTSPHSSLGMAMRFLGKQFELSQLDASLRKTVTSMGSRAVHSRLREAITPQTVGRFRQELTEDEVALCESMLGDLLIRLGYKSDT